MRNYFNYLRLPASSSEEQLHAALNHVPEDEYDIHHVMAEDTSLTHYKRVHLQCTAMAVLLASMKDDNDILEHRKWQQRLSEFSVLDDRLD